MKAILFLGTSLVGSQYTREAVESLGFRPIFLLRIAEYSGNPRRAVEECEHYEADVNSLDDIRRAISANNLMSDVIAITSLLDETLANACAIAKQYNIIGPDLVLADLTNKAKVQKIIPEFSPPNLTFDSSSLTHAELEKFLVACSDIDEFVLKPGVSSGAVGTSILKRSSTNFEEIIQQVTNSKIDGATTYQNWVLQPRITGRLHSLEGYVKNGEINFLGFSRRVRKVLTETMNEFPVDKEISECLQKRCREAVMALVSRSGYKNGYFHCEFIVTSGSAYLIDGNMGRVAGAAIVPQIALIYGKNLVDIYKHVFDLGLFYGANTNSFEYNRMSDLPTLSINYCVEKSAIVLNIALPADMTCKHIQIADNGKSVPAVGESDSAWVGFLVGFRTQVLEEIKNVVINTNTGAVPAFFTLTESFMSNSHLFGRASSGSDLTKKRNFEVAEDQRAGSVCSKAS